MFLISGCSVTRKSADEVISGGRRKSISIEELKKSNLTGGDFQIQKALITIKGEGGDEKIIASMKYADEGKLLVSLRSLAGIEAVRFYIADDTILINDRLNKKVYHGSSEYSMNKYGMNLKYIPVIFGDVIIEESDTEDVYCNEGEAEIIEINDESSINYNIDCSSGRVRNVTIENSVYGQVINISFEKFIKQDDLSFYRNIVINDTRESRHIKISIERITRVLTGELEFIPGKNYEDVLLR